MKALLGNMQKVISPTSQGARGRIRWPRRRRFVVDRGLQYRLLIISVAYVIFCMAVMAGNLFLPLIFQMQGADPASTETLDAANRFLYLHVKFWPATVLSLICVVLHSIRTSHKLAGPLYRFRMILVSLRQGNIPKPVRLRRGDYLQRDMDTANAMLEGIRTRIMEAQTAHHALHQHISRRGERLDGAFTKNAGEFFDELLRLESQVGQKLATFKIED